MNFLVEKIYEYFKYKFINKFSIIHFFEFVKIEFGNINF